MLEARTDHRHEPSPFSCHSHPRSRQPSGSCRSRAKFPAHRGARSEQLHLTLRFIGEVDEAVARDIDTEVGRIVAAPFEIALEAREFRRREPAALWAGIRTCPALIQLAGSCETAIRNAGLSPEPRRYKPHVTIAYLNGTRDVEVAHFLADAAEFRCAPFIVDHFCMYSSRATRAGSHYVEEAVYPLTG
jgi:2'-5' RNA ligase